MGGAGGGAQGHITLTIDAQLNNGVPGLGGGGGGGKGSSNGNTNASNANAGGDGGSGVVIIRLRTDPLPRVDIDAPGWIEKYLSDEPSDLPMTL